MSGTLAIQLYRFQSCWIWTGAKQSCGYGTVYVPRLGTQLCHRLAWVLKNGAIPPGLNVLHRCDNPACVNPHHLFLGTHRDNMRDMLVKRRSRYGLNPLRGESHPNSKLRSADISAIRNSSESSFDLAKRYSVSASSIWRVRTGTTYKLSK